MPIGPEAWSNETAGVDTENGFEAVVPPVAETVWMPCIDDGTVMEPVNVPVALAVIVGGVVV